MTPEQAEFLRSHKLAVLATGRRDGSPQVSTMAYAFYGDQVVMSVTTDRAKWPNVGRQPRVGMVVNEGRQQLVLYGTAERVADDPERLQLTKQVREALGRLADEDDATIAAQLDRDKRVILRITPDTVFMNE